MPTIIPIVEGEGEVAALPELLYRILYQMHGRHDVLVGWGKSGVVNAKGRDTLENNLAKFLHHAQNKPDSAAILILVDADNDCPVIKANELAYKGRQINAAIPIEVVYAHREYESWFLASWDTVKGSLGLEDTLSPSNAVENVADPKQWITNLMPQGQSYKPTKNQSLCSTAIDLDLAHQNSRSFRRLCHALELLVGAMDEASTP